MTKLVALHFATFAVVIFSALRVFSMLSAAVLGYRLLFRRTVTQCVCCLSVVGLSGASSVCFVCRYSLHSLDSFCHVRVVRGGDEMFLL